MTVGVEEDVVGADGLVRLLGRGVGAKDAGLEIARTPPPATRSMSRVLSFMIRRQIRKATLTEA